MNDSQGKWQFGIADVLALLTVVGAGLGLFSIVRGVAPIVNPAVIGLLVASMLGACLAGFWGRKQPRSVGLVAACAIIVLCCASLIASLVARY
jgi:hypothetical protein